MKLNKILVSLVVMSMFMAASHQALSQTSTQTSKKSTKRPAKKAQKKGVKKVSKNTKSTSSSQSRPADQVNVLSNTSSPSTRLVVKTRTIVKEAKSPFSGAVKLSLGQDSNLDPERPNIDDTFFQIEPSIKFASQYIDFSFSGSSTDFSNSDYSNLYSNSQATSSVGLKLEFTPALLSTTTLTGTYNSARSTNSFEGVNENNVDLGMSNRFAEVKIAESLKFTTSKVTSEIGGYYTYHNALTKEDDNAGEPTGANRIYERDTKEFGATGKVSVKATPWLTLSAAPKVSNIKYDELVARESDGKRPIFVAGKSDPKESLINSEISLDAKFGFLGSSITPKIVIGQVADENSGGRDQDVMGGGVAAEFVLNKSNELKITPNFLYKKSEFDQWTNAIDPGKDRREDYNISTSITASLMFTKNFGAGISYSKTEVRSNLPDPTINFEKEVASTAVTINF